LLAENGCIEVNRSNLGASGGGWRIRGLVAEFGSAAELLIWANAELAKSTATARNDRKNLLVIGKVKLLQSCIMWNCFPFVLRMP
jgi:hypothetical protein